MTKCRYKSSPVKDVMQFVIHFDLCELGVWFLNNLLSVSLVGSLFFKTATCCFCALRSPSSFCQHVCDINCELTQGFLLFHPTHDIYTFILPSVASLPQPGGVLHFLIHSQSFSHSYSVRCFRCAFSNSTLLQMLVCHCRTIRICIFPFYEENIFHYLYCLYLLLVVYYYNIMPFGSLWGSINDSFLFVKCW